MSDDYEVGYKRPPKQHRFKPNNQAASKGRRRAKKAEKTLSLPEIMRRALSTKRKVKRGDEVFTVPVAEIMIERWILIMTTGSIRDSATAMQLIEKYCPDVLQRATETLEIFHHRAEGSSIAPPPNDLLEGPKE